ncbi:hypothetical protein [Mesorhizobium sp. BE184]|uniref:hypothetical protein n=1 Tax=Mesorhizobium sp. BE184 TaxID=2817714 RepID=UPI00285D0E4C|nr:hypothetical protein [Mesorhizobium sp. BE184]MDR7034632.1 hypothetical protein [Mesorhizobium sp. BE184]
MENAVLGYIVAWIPVILMLWIFGYFVMKLVRVQRGSVAALDRIAMQLEMIQRRLADNEFDHKSKLDAPN